MLQATLKNLASALSPTHTLAISRVVVGAGASKLISTTGIAAETEASAKVASQPEEGCPSRVLDPAELEAEMLDVEMDRDEGPEFAVAEGLPTPRVQLDPLGRPCDLEFEYDRDDPEAVDQEELQKIHGLRAKKAPPAEGVGAGEMPQYTPGRDSGPKFEDTT